MAMNINSNYANFTEEQSIKSLDLEVHNEHKYIKST